MEKSLTWIEMKSVLKIGNVVHGIILRHEPYGAFVDLGYAFEGLISITNFRDEGRMTPDQYPRIGEQVAAVILSFTEHNNQIWLGVKPSQMRDM